MLNYYNELKNDILEALEEERVRNIIEKAKNKEDIYEKLTDIFFIDDSITGNASGSYYFSAYKARKHCYNFFRDVFEALEEYSYNKELQNFKTFIALVEEGYLNIENMTIDYEALNEDERCFAFYALEEIEEINFEAIDVITRCYFLDSVLWKVLDNYLD